MICSCSRCGKAMIENPNQSKERQLCTKCDHNGAIAFITKAVTKLNIKRPQFVVPIPKPA